MQTKTIVRKIFFSRFYYFIPGILLMAVEIMLNTYVPRQTGKVVDMLGLGPLDLSPVHREILLLAAAAALAFGVKFVWRFLLVGSGRWYEKTLRAKVFEQLSYLDSTFYDQNRTGDLITRVISDVGAIRQALSFGITSIFTVVLTLIMPLSVMVRTMSLPLSLASFSAVPAIVLFLVLVRKSISRRFLKIQEAASDLGDKVDENLSGIREIKSYAREQYESEQFAGLSLKRYWAELKLVKMSALLGPAATVGFSITFAVFILIGGKLVMDGTMTVGNFITFNTYIGIMTTPMKRISRTVQVWQKGMASMRRLDKIFCSHPLVSDDKADPSITDFEPAIQADHLTFGYAADQPPVLRDISFQVPKGGTLGVMGKTGSGKSALIDALSRRYPSPAGQLKLGGHDISAIPLDLLRDKTGCVIQNGFLFSDTVLGNILFYCQKATEDDAKRAAVLADLDGNVAGFPQGYQTVVGERGVTLSGGQRQRLSIARALVKKPELLLLDDCMSAVDTATEETIIHNIKTELKDVTTVITAHRVSAVAHADEIIYLEDGRIVERGTHESLLALKGRYYALYVAQTEGKGATAC